MSWVFLDLFILSLSTVVWGGGSLSRVAVSAVVNRFWHLQLLFLLQLQTSCRPSSADPAAPSCHHPGARGSREDNLTGQPAENTSGVHGGRRHHTTHRGFYWYDPSPCAQVEHNCLSISHSRLTRCQFIGEIKLPHKW